MLLVISPAKTLDYDSHVATGKFSQPDFLPQSKTLISRLRKLSPEDISDLMHVDRRTQFFPFS